MVRRRVARARQGVSLTGGTAEPGRTLPSTERGRRARAEIVTAAATLMYQRGVRSTSLDEVLTAAGCGKSQLYHYFGGKTDLVAAVIERQLEFVLAAQPALQRIDSWATLDDWLVGIAEMHAQPGGPFACPLGALAVELKDDEALRPHLAAAFARWMTILAAGLRRMRDRGDLVADVDVERLASNVIAALQGGMLIGRVSGDAAAMSDAVDTARRQILRWRRPGVQRSPSPDRQSAG